MNFDLDMPCGLLIHADRAYTDYVEDLLLEAAGITLQPQRVEAFWHGVRPQVQAEQHMLDSFDGGAQKFL
jgi:hypothetical protein